MTISKQTNLLITLDNDLQITNREESSAKKAIVIDFFDKDNIYKQKSGVLYISNPGEYEYENVLIKVSKGLNIFLSSDNIKIYCISNIQDAEKDKNASLADIFIFDSYSNINLNSKEVLEIDKIAQPKIIIANSKFITDTIPNSEKTSKVKIKMSDLDTILDTKIYII